MTRGDAPRRENAFTLLRRLVSGTVALAKLEAQRGRQEVTRNLIEYRTGVVLLAIAFGFVILAFIVLMILMVLVLAALTGIPGWVIALILFVVLLIVAGILGWRGLQKVQEPQLAPEETIAAVKEEIEWAKSRLLRRD
jgi:succinate dehydrogenase hydrophobic anchor subunit